MSSNTAIRITEMEDGKWEVLCYDVDTPIEEYRERSKLVRYDTLDAALDRAQTIQSEYGLEIVRLKDKEKPADIVLAEVAQKYVREVGENVGWEDVVEAFIQGADYQEQKTKRLHNSWCTSPGCNIG